jgi:hypothetical protein
VRYGLEDSLTGKFSIFKADEALDKDLCKGKKMMKAIE